MKSIKAISLSSDVIEDIKRRSKQGTFNFSEWVENEYCNKFMDENKKVNLIKDHEKKIIILEKEIEEIRLRKQTFTESVSKSEKRFLSDVIRLNEEGYQWKPLLRRYNATFNKEFNLKKFKELAIKFNDSRK